MTSVENPEVYMEHPIAALASNDGHFMAHQLDAATMPEPLVPPDAGQSLVWEIPVDERSLMTRVAEAYFTPRKFEEDGRVYERLGIRAFKKWMPTTGDMVNRHIWSRFGKNHGLTDPSIEGLRNFAEQTRVIEGLHLGFVALTGSVIAATPPENIGHGAIYASMLVPVNLYPIMLQRYNRSRVLPIIGRKEARTSRSDQ